MIYYSKTDKDYMFIIITGDEDKIIIFDCYYDKWKYYDKENVSVDSIKNNINVMDLLMAGSYIDLYKDEIDFPEGTKKEFIKLLFENIGKN